MFRLLRLLKLLRVKELLEVVEEHVGMSMRPFGLVIEVAKMLFFAHTLGCFWFGISRAAGAGSFGDALPTWIESYGGGEDEEITTSSYYLWSFYWALTTLTTVGYGDITPQNDPERWYAAGALLVGGVVFGLMLSNVGVLVASLDRQAAAVEEKLDSVKEYIFLRGLPRDLSLRMRTHFKYYYEQTPALDEAQLLSECPPGLRSEVERFITRKTLGQVPLLQSLDPDFQSELFPFIKPVSYAAGTKIFTKGEASRDLIFLVEGVVNVMSAMDSAQVQKVVTPTEEIFISNESKASGEPEAVLACNGIIGDDLLRGKRRMATHIARSECHALSLSKSDMLTVFERNPREARRIVNAMLAPLETREKLRNLSRRLLIGITKDVNRQMWASLVVQQAWATYVKVYLDRAPELPSASYTPAEELQVTLRSTRARSAVAEAQRGGLAVVGSAGGAGAEANGGGKATSQAASLEEAIHAFENRVLSELGRLEAQLGSVEGMVKGELAQLRHVVNATST